jgi:hypothetical protein
MNSSLLKPPSPVGASEDPASTPTRKVLGRETSWPGVEETLPWSPRSLLGGAPDGTPLEGSVVDLVLPVRLRWHSSMMDCTSLFGGTADAIGDVPPPNSTSPSLSSPEASVIRLVLVVVVEDALLAGLAAGVKLEGAAADADADRATLLAEVAGGAKLEVAVANAVSPARLRLYASLPKPRSLVGVSGGAELEGAAADVVSPATLRLYASMLDRQSLVAGTSDGAELKGAAADAVSPATLRLYASMLDHQSLVAETSDGAELKGAAADTVLPGQWRLNYLFQHPGLSRKQLNGKSEFRTPRRPKH